MKKNNFIVTDISSSFDNNKKIFFNIRKMDNDLSENLYLADILDLNKEEIKKKFLNFYSLLFSNQSIDENFLYSNIFEKSPFKINLYHALQLFVLIDLLKKEKIYITEIDIKNRALCEATKKALGFDNKNIYLYKNIIKNFFSSIKFLIKFTITLVKTKKVNKNLNCKRIFFIFGNMFTSYFPKSFKQKNTIVFNCNFLNTSNIQNSNILSYFSFYNFLQLINCFLKIVFGSLKNTKNYSLLLNSKYSFLTTLWHYDFLKSYCGAIALENFIFNKCFNNIKKKILFKNRKIKIFHTCEFSNWEFILNKVFNKINFETYGYVHSTLRYWVLNYFFTKKIYKKLDDNEYVPNNILVNSFFQKKVFSNYIPQNKIKVVEATRFDYLVNVNKKIKKLKTKITNKVKKVLILGEIDNDTNKYLIEYALNLSKKHSFKIFFKNHPSSVSKIIKLNNCKILKKKEYKKIYYNYDLYITSCTSAAIEFCFLKKRIIIFNYNKLNLSPLYHYFKYNFIKDINYKKIFFKNRVNLKKYFIFNKKYILWKKLLNENT